MAKTKYYSSPAWRRLSRATKERDGFQCQICGDIEGDPYTILNAHHIVARAEGGSDTLDNLITLCDLCHAVVTNWWHRFWFGNNTEEERVEMRGARLEYLEFLALDAATRRERQRDIWERWGRVPTVINI